MATTLLESSALSAFCGSIAVMLSAGIQTDEAVHMLCDNREESQFRDVCSDVYQDLIDGGSLCGAMEKSGAFPSYAVDLVRAGETSGRLEEVLRNLELYYDEEDRMFSKISTSVGYPAALLCIMAAILAVTVGMILPVFVGVYENMSASMTAGSFSTVGLSVGIGWASLVVTILCAVVVLYISLSVRSEKGRLNLIDRLANFPLTRDAIYQLALSRYTAALATYVASGVTSEEATKLANETVNNPQLAKRVAAVYESMTDLSNPRSLAQAIAENDVFEPFYARMLAVGTVSGGVDATLASLSQTFFDDALVKLDRVTNAIEPILAAFLTISVGATLISVMLPLIGIMTSVG
jgi:type IV pilus assembly protein PilC